MTIAENFMKKGKCKNNYFSSKSNSAYSDLITKSDVLKLHDKCPNLKRGCQKIMAFTPHQYMLKGGSVKTELEKNFQRNKKGL